MCEPTTIMLAVSAAGTAMAAYGTYQQAEAAKDSAEYNATVSEYAAQDAEARGRQEAMKARQQAAQLRGTQRATMAARGLDLGEGTPLSLLEQTDYFTEVDQATIRNNADKEAWAKRVQGTGFRNEADSINPGFSAMTTLLTGTGNVASQWYRANPSAAGSGAGSSWGWDGAPRSTSRSGLGLKF